MIGSDLQANGSIARAMGKGSSPRVIITSLVLAFTLFFYIFTVGSLLKPTVYVLQDRISVYRLFYEYILGEYADHLLIGVGTIFWLVFSLSGRAKSISAGIYGSVLLTALVLRLPMLLNFSALISIPIIILLYFWDKYWSKSTLRGDLSSLVTSYLSIIGIGTGSLSLFIYSLTILGISLGTFRFKDYEYVIFILFSTLSPVLLFMVTLSLPLKLLINLFIKKMSQAEICLSPYNLRPMTKIFYLSFFAGLSITLGLIAHQPTVNTDSHMIGADTANYVKFIERLENSGGVDVLLNQVFVSMHGGDRPLTLLFLFFATKISPYDHSFTIDRTPLVLSPILVLVVFFLTRELTSNDIAALLASFLTAVSFQTLVGTYAGFYANWLAIIVGYLSIVFAFKHLKKPKKSTLVIYTILIVVTLFCHVYTWTILTVVTVIFLGVMLRLNYYSKRSAGLLLLAVFGSVGIDGFRLAVTGVAGGLEQDINVAQEQQTGLGQFQQRWYNLLSTSQFHYGGLFGNALFLALVLYWLFKSSIHEPSNIFIIIFLSVGIFAIFFGNWVVQSRVFYNIPFQIPAAIGLTFLLYTKKEGALMVVAVCIWLMAFSIRAVTNF